MPVLPAPERPTPATPHELTREEVFVVLAGFLALILYRAIWTAFLANPASTASSSACC